LLLLLLTRILCRYVCQPWCKPISLLVAARDTQS
jgi:hypothetical protein